MPDLFHLIQCPAIYLCCYTGEGIIPIYCLVIFHCVQIPPLTFFKKFFVVPSIKATASHVLGRFSTTKLHPTPTTFALSGC